MNVGLIPLNAMMSALSMTGAVTAVCLAVIRPIQLIDTIHHAIITKDIHAALTNKRMGGIYMVDYLHKKSTHDYIHAALTNDFVHIRRTGIFFVSIKSPIHQRDASLDWRSRPGRCFGFTKDPIGATCTQVSQAYRRSSRVANDGAQSLESERAMGSQEA